MDDDEVDRAAGDRKDRLVPGQPHIADGVGDVVGPVVGSGAHGADVDGGIHRLHRGAVADDAVRVGGWADRFEVVLPVRAKRPVTIELVAHLPVLDAVVVASRGGGGGIGRNGPAVVRSALVGVAAQSAASCFVPRAVVDGDHRLRSRPLPDERHESVEVGARNGSTPAGIVGQVRHPVVVVRRRAARIAKRLDAELVHQPRRSVGDEAAVPGAVFRPTAIGAKFATGLAAFTVAEFGVPPVRVSAGPPRRSRCCRTSRSCRPRHNQARTLR